MSKGETKEPPRGDRQVGKNKRAYFDYEIIDTLEAGLVLMGSEARSLRVNGCDLTDAWVDIQDNEAWLKGMSIAELKHAAFGHERKRKRKLLLHKAQIEQLRGAKERDGMTLVVTRVYFKDNRAKAEVALARGKKKHDKRQAIRERQSTREAEAAMRRAR